MAVEATLKEGENVGQVLSGFCLFLIKCKSPFSAPECNTYHAEKFGIYYISLCVVDSLCRVLKVCSATPFQHGVLMWTECAFIAQCTHHPPWVAMATHAFLFCFTDLIFDVGVGLHEWLGGSVVGGVLMNTHLT